MLAALADALRKYLAERYIITYTKILANTVISLRAGPEKLGLRPETVDSIQQQVPVLRKLSRYIQDITGITVPEVELALSCALHNLRICHTTPPPSTGGALQ